MASLMLVKAIPNQVINEGAAYKPFDLKQFIQAKEANSALRFQAGLADGRPLPQGLICTADGTLSGIPARGTEGNYLVVIKAENIEGETLSAEFSLLIKPVNVVQQHDLLRDLKSQVWDAVGKGLPVPEFPDLNAMLTWPVTPLDVYYLLERFAYLTIWDAYNPDSPGEAQLLILKGVSVHYQVFDRGSCIVGAPKDLFSYARTPQDALVTAKAMAEEVYKRGWTIEFSGFDKMVRAAWVKLQILAKQQGKAVEILHYIPPAEDAAIFTKELEALGKLKPSL